MSIVGFDRSILFVSIKLMMPVGFAAILVYLDTPWTVIMVPGLFLVYFCVQLLWIQAKTSLNDWLIFVIFMLVSYTSLLLFIEEEPIPLNYTGWICITLLTTLTSFLSIKYLHQLTKTIKLLCIGKQRQNAIKSSFSDPVSPELLSAFVHDAGF